MDLPAEKSPRHSRLLPLRVFWSILALALGAGYVAFAAILGLHPAIEGGGVIELPVVIHGEGQEVLAGLQFDLHFDPARYEVVRVLAANGALEAGKDIIFAPGASGEGRVLITGFNNQILPDGHVASILLRPLEGSAGQSGIELSRVLGTDPLGNAIECYYEASAESGASEDLEAGEEVPEASPEASEDPLDEDIQEAPVAQEAAEAAPEGSASTVDAVSTAEPVQAASAWTDMGAMLWTAPQMSAKRST